MICPTCQAVVDAADALCPACARPQPHAATRDPLVIEAAGAQSPAAATGASTTPRALVPVRAVQNPLRTVLPQLPALVWRQPAVRAIARTGASAVALSVALRLVGHWARARRLAAEGTVTHRLAEDLLGLPPQPAHHARRGIISEETLVYLRRTVRSE